MDQLVHRLPEVQEVLSSEPIIVTSLKIFCYRIEKIKTKEKDAWMQVIALRLCSLSSAQENVKYKSTL